jgi:isopenicillin-N epimerase
MLSPKGAGFLYARLEVQNRVDPLIVSWGYQSMFIQPRESTFIDPMQWTGTRDPAAALAIPAAIAFMQANHREDIRVSCHNLLRNGMEMLSTITGLSPLYPLDSRFYHQMGTIPIPRVRDLNELKYRLYADFRIEIPVIDWNGRYYLRLSVQGYNSAGDIDTLVKAVAELLPSLKI